MRLNLKTGTKVQKNPLITSICQHFLIIFGRKVWKIRVFFLSLQRLYPEAKANKQKRKG